MAKTTATFLARAGRLAAVVLVVCLVAAAALGAKARLDAGPYDLPMVNGVGSVAVTSGSMEPELPVGCLAIVLEQDEYAEGDVITYVSPTLGSFVTHRISGFDEFGRVLARGDANNVDDPAFDPSLIEGRVVACVPLAGMLAQSLQTPGGLAALLLIAAAGLLYGFGRSARRACVAPTLCKPTEFPLNIGLSARSRARRARSSRDQGSSLDETARLEG